MDPASYRISERAVERVAEVAILSVPGTRDIDAKLAGLAGRSFPRVDAHIDRPAGSVALDVEIVTSYPAPVGAITDEVRRTVGTHVETLTGLVVSRVNIAVADAQALALGERVTRGDLMRHPAGVVPTPIEVAPSVVSSPVVKAPVKLAEIEVDSSLYDDLVPVEAPQPPAVRHVSAPPPRRARSVVAPIPRALTPVSLPSPVRPVEVAAPTPAPIRTPAVPAPAPLAHITVDQFAERRPVRVKTPAALAPVEVTPFARRIPVELPAPEPLRAIEVDAPRQLTQVSLPARRPLDPIYAQRPTHVEVMRPDPEPLRRISFTPVDVTVPVAPQPRPLDEITVDPANAEDHADAQVDEANARARRQAIAATKEAE